MSRRHWLLPDGPTSSGCCAASSRSRCGGWTRSRPGPPRWRRAGRGDVRALEHEADTAKRELRARCATRSSRRWIPRICSRCRAGSTGSSTTPRTRSASRRRWAVRRTRRPPRWPPCSPSPSAHIDDGVARIASHPGDAADAADAAVRAERHLEKAYRAAMGALAELDHPRTVIGRQELYRRCSRMGETAVDVAERLIYAVHQGELTAAARLRPTTCHDGGRLRFRRGRRSDRVQSMHPSPHIVSAVDLCRTFGEGDAAVHASSTSPSTSRRAAHGDHGAVGVRQVDADAPARRPGPPDVRLRRDRRHGALGPARPRPHPPAP